MIVAAANDGGATDPAWHLNLLGDPVGDRGGSRRADPRDRPGSLPEDEGAAWWDRILLAAPDYERYARATTRRFPIVRLTPVAAAPEACTGGRRSVDDPRSWSWCWSPRPASGAVIAAWYARKR